MEIPPENGPQARSRRMSRRTLLRVLAGGAAGAVVNAAWIEPARLTVTRRDLRCDDLPPELEGLRIGVLADFHYRPDDDADLLERVVEQVGRERLDLITLAGDFADRDPRVLDPLASALGRMEAALGVYAVMGNHDGWHSGLEVTRRRLEKAGIHFLNNQNSLLSVRGQALAIAGTDFVWLGKPDPLLTLKGIRAGTPVIALVHEPDYFDVMAAQRKILLQVSGHTHGGQCRVPLAGYAPVTVKHGKKYIYGEYERDGSKLFVTRGVGTTGLRVRFACPPELAVLTLRQAIPAPVDA
jgi:predicted MPP superfamily phosphohydrolase